MKEYNPQRKLLVDKIKKSGGFWSYDTPPYGINDESPIEAALSNLEFENMDYLTNVFSISKIRKVWTEKMLPQSDRYNILNFLLAVFIFNVKQPKEYLKKYAKKENQVILRGNGRAHIGKDRGAI